MTMRKHLIDLMTTRKPFSCCVTLNKLLNLSESQLLKNEQRKAYQLPKVL